MGGWIEGLAMAALFRAMCLSLLLCMRIAQIMWLVVRVPLGICRLTVLNYIQFPSCSVTHACMIICLFVCFIQRPGTGKNSHKEGRSGANSKTPVNLDVAPHECSPLQMRELDLSKAVAERSLREHKGDLIKALHALTE